MSNSLTLFPLSFRVGEFWIACDFCDTWYDGKCVQVRLCTVMWQPDEREMRQLHMAFMACLVQFLGSFLHWYSAHRTILDPSS